MAHPIKLAENAVNYFISQWLYGLKPSLRLNTDEDGSILITSEVASFPVLSLDDTQYSGNNYKPRRRRSGKSARHRRNLIRNSNVNRYDLFDNSFHLTCQFSCVFFYDDVLLHNPEVPVL